jgi:hypothetical protein
MAAAASDNPSAATSHPSSTTQDPSSTTDHRSIEISYDDGRQSRRLGGGVDESTTDGIMMKGVTIKEMDDIERTSSPSNDSNGADSDDEKDGGAEGHGEHVNLARQVTDTGEIVPNSYLDYIAKLRNVWKDAPDVIVDMKDLNYTIPLPNTSKYVHHHLTPTRTLCSALLPFPIFYIPTFMSAPYINTVTMT